MPYSSTWRRPTSRQSRETWGTRTWGGPCSSTIASSTATPRGRRSGPSRGNWTGRRGGLWFQANDQATPNGSRLRLPAQTVWRWPRGVCGVVFTAFSTTHHVDALAWEDSAWQLDNPLGGPPPVTHMSSNLVSWLGKRPTLLLHLPRRSGDMEWKGNEMKSVEHRLTRPGPTDMSLDKPGMSGWDDMSEISLGTQHFGWDGVGIIASYTGMGGVDINGPCGIFWVHRILFFLRTGLNHHYINYILFLNNILYSNLIIKN